MAKSRPRPKSRRRVTIDVGELQTQLRSAGADESMQNFLDSTLPLFAKNFEKSLKNNIKRHGIGVSGDLEKYLFSRSVTFADGNAKAGVKFNHYGLFVDKGAGKGIMVSERETGRGITSQRVARGLSKRVAKPWLSEIMPAFELKLENLLTVAGANFIEDFMREKMISELTIQF